jgi:hypothetical protein
LKDNRKRCEHQMDPRSLEMKVRLQRLPAVVTVMGTMMMTMSHRASPHRCRKNQTLMIPPTGLAPKVIGPRAKSNKKQMV